MEEKNLVLEVESLQKNLGKKQCFEEAINSLAAILRDRYPSASPTLRASIYAAVCRVATILQTRYTAPGFWMAGLKLFEEAEKLVTEPHQKEHMKKSASRAHEHLCEMDTEIPSSNVAQTADNRYLFEGHLTMGREPPPPAWLQAQNFLTALAVAQDWRTEAESSRRQEENDASPLANNTTSTIPEIIQELINNMRNGNSEEFHASFQAMRASTNPELMQELLNNMQNDSGFPDLESAIEASLREIGLGPKRAPPASKEVVANLPIVTVTEEVIARLGSETECAVCRENLVLNDQIQELPCKHLFHPPCLKPWLDENNSCPICRHELRTDDHEYESRKEREKEEEEERKGAANAVRGGEFMYV